MENRRGFTLAELLIVVAIIGVLVAIAVPVFSNALKKAQETACLANRTSVEHAIAIEQLDGTAVDLAAATAEAENTLGDLSNICPAGGRCYLEENADGSWAVKCSLHSATAVETVKGSIEDILDTSTDFGKTTVEGATISNYVLSYFNGRAVGSTLDSTGPNFGAPIKKELAKALGITEDFDFAFKKRSANEYEVYVSDPLKGLDAATDKATVTGYVFTTESTTTLKLTKTGTQQDNISIKTNEVENKATKKNEKFNILDVAGYSWD